MVADDGVGGTAGTGGYRAYARDREGSHRGPGATGDRARKRTVPRQPAGHRPRRRTVAGTAADDGRARRERPPVAWHWRGRCGEDDSAYTACGCLEGGRPGGLWRGPGLAADGRAE